MKRRRFLQWFGVASATAGLSGEVGCAFPRGIPLRIPTDDLQIRDEEKLIKTLQEVEGADFFDLVRYTNFAYQQLNKQEIPFNNRILPEGNYFDWFEKGDFHSDILVGNKYLSSSDVTQFVGRVGRVIGHLFDEKAGEVESYISSEAHSRMLEDTLRMNMPASYEQRADEFGQGYLFLSQLDKHLPLKHKEAAELHREATQADNIELASLTKATNEDFGTARDKAINFYLEAVSQEGFNSNAIERVQANQKGTSNWKEGAFYKSNREVLFIHVRDYLRAMHKYAQGLTQGKNFVNTPVTVKLPERPLWQVQLDIGNFMFWVNERVLRDHINERGNVGEYRLMLSNLSPKTAYDITPNEAKQFIKADPEVKDYLGIKN